MRIRRLLELDRAAGRKVRSKDAEEANFAFFSDEAPGSGADFSFSEYEAFALVNALILMANRWPASFAVSVMRRVRRDLEREHSRILQQDPDKGSKMPRAFTHAAVRLAKDRASPENEPTPAHPCQLKQISCTGASSFSCIIDAHHACAAAVLERAHWRIASSIAMPPELTREGQNCRYN
jgi:hypothetical protein